MSIGLTASWLVNWFREDALITLGANELRGENLHTKARAQLPRQRVHPRSLVNRFDDLQGEFVTLCRQLFARGWTRPHVIVCLIGLDEGGYTEIEIRAVREAAMGAGLRKIWLVSGPLVATEARQIFSSGKPPPGVLP